MKNGIIFFSILILISACKKHDDGVRNENEIWLHNSRVDPYETKIAKGTTITIINKDATTHTASEVNNKFYSGKLKPGASFTYTFNDTGYYSFICNYHNTMRGNITVK